MKTNRSLCCVAYALLPIAEQEGHVTSDALEQCLGPARRGPAHHRLLREYETAASDRGHAGRWRIQADLSRVTLQQLRKVLLLQRFSASTLGDLTADFARRQAAV